MTIEQFRKHKSLPYEWRKLMNSNGVLQLVLQVMSENHPCRFTLNRDNNGDISATRANIEFGLTMGYSKFEDTLKLMAQPFSEPKDVGEPTYEPPEKVEVE